MNSQYLNSRYWLFCYKKILKNPNNARKFPLRLPDGASETTTNPNIEAAYGNGTYVYSENVWWAGGTR